METHSPERVKRDFDCSYRTYEEWKRCLKVEVPTSSIFGSYRTYEEWKPDSLLCRAASPLTFLPYLWGMETLLNSSVVRWVIKVLTVPMRNGNACEYDREFDTFNFVLTVPMRNGNQILCFVGLPVLWRSYRTYEEWKHRSAIASSTVRLVLTVPMRNGNWAVCQQSRNAW